MSNYFDARALSRLGLPDHVIESFRTTYDNSGGSTQVPINLPDINALMAAALDQERLARNLKQRIDELEQRIEAIPSQQAQLSRISGQIDQLQNLILSQSQPFPSDLLRRIEQLEAATA